MGLSRRDREPHPRKSPLRRAVGILSWVVALTLAVGWVAFLRPAGMGGPAGYVIVSGESMEPLLHTGDLAVVTRETNYDVGDVVAYRIPAGDVGGGMLVIHRVIGGSIDDGLILQGDNRDTPDMWRPQAEDVVGSLRVYVPHAGTALFLLRTPLVIAGVAGFLGFWVVATSGERKAKESDEEGAIDEITVPQPAPVPVPVRPAVVITAPSRSTGHVAAAAVVGLSVGSFLWSRAR